MMRKCREQNMKLHYSKVNVYLWYDVFTLEYFTKTAM